MVYQSKQSVEAEARRQQEIEAGLVSVRFPTVKKIRMEVEFHDATGARVQRRCRDLPPNTFALFDMKCPLDSTPIDFKNIVTHMIKDRETKKRGEIKCPGSTTESHHAATYNIHIEYQTKRR